MDYTKFSNTPTQVMTVLAIAGAAFVAGCGNSNHQDKTSDPSATAQPERPTADQPAAGTPDEQRAAEQAGDEPATEAPADREAEPAPDPESQEASPPAASEGFTELGITDTVVGEGEAVEPGATVTVHYRGTFRESGEEFDSSYSRGEPAVFPLNGVIAGFSEGLLGMKVGGKRRVEIPWNMAYGAQGRPPVIPPRSDLVFDLELVDVQNPEPPKKPDLGTEFEGEPQDLGEGLVVRDIETGTGEEELKPGATAIVHYRGVLADSGVQFDSSYDRGQPAKFKLDPGALIEGFSRGLMGMKAGGKRRIEIPSALGYGSRGSPPKIPGNADLVFEVEVLSFVNPRELSTEWVSEKTLENGLVVRTVKEGDADALPIPADGIAVMHAMGALEDGTVFESTFESGQTITVPIEMAGIEGWTLGIAGMKPGEVRQFVVPPELGFGEEGQPPVIPANATLIFEIELFEWREPREFSTEFAGEPTELEEGVTIRDVSIGQGPEAAQGQDAVIHFMGQLPDGTDFANTFDTGNLQIVPLNDDPQLIGLRRAIIGMKVGGVRRIELAPDKAFGEEGSPPVIPADSPVYFEVELVALN